MEVLDNVLVDAIVPYLSPPNKKWKMEIFEALKDVFLLGNLSRTKNAERIDISTSLIFPNANNNQILVTGESKDHGHNLTSETMGEILDRIPETHLHIVATRSLQGQYNKLLNDSERFNHLHDTEFCVIGNGELKTVSRLPSKFISNMIEGRRTPRFPVVEPINPKRLVLFILVELQQ